MFLECYRVYRFSITSLHILTTTNRHNMQQIQVCTQSRDGLGSSVGIATDYGLDGPGIEEGNIAEDNYYGWRQEERQWEPQK
jgi:hypothetical protein